MDRNIRDLLPGGGIFDVALRKESVDRNSSALYWFSMADVALRKESVDRNMRQVMHIHAQIPGRSPQGERG